MALNVLFVLLKYVSKYLEKRDLHNNKEYSVSDSTMQHAIPQQMWRIVTAIYTRSTAETWWQNSSGDSAIVTHHHR